MAYDDKVDGRVGHWAQTSLGGRIFPEDPRLDEIFVSDIANGLAKEQRYGAAARVDLSYTVAEHCYLLTQYGLRQDMTPDICMAILFHDAPEYVLKDQYRALKNAIRHCYKPLEEKWHRTIAEKYDLLDAFRQFGPLIKDLDRRIVPLEKARVMRYEQPWAYDTFEPLQGVEIECFSPKRAKELWLDTYDFLCKLRGMQPEKWEI